MDIPRICIAGTHSGCGKTTIATGLMAALVARGLDVQPFKVGPDFIDPSHHSAICGRTSRNLDPFMMGEPGVSETFSKACRGADIAVIEGVMGLYDGLEGTGIASTAHVAKLLATPVVLVADVGAMSRSANALVRGFRDFDPDLSLAGAIFNRVGGPWHRQMIEASLETEALGWLPGKEELAVKSRHLGLNMAGEDDRLKTAGETIEEHCNISRIVEIAGTAPPLQCTDQVLPDGASGRTTIGVAVDEAFCFYYRDNLDRLAEAGAVLEFFSPVRDRLPRVDALYLGGGYPELHAEKLEASPCRAEIQAAIDDGMPAYAECGGLMYLTESISAGRDYRMVGALPARSIMTDRLQALGYIEARFAGGPVFRQGLRYRGHEFHFSRVECREGARFAVDTNGGKGIAGGHDGIYEHNAIGAYTHAYFTAEFARSFVEAAAAYGKK